MKKSNYQISSFLAQHSFKSEAEWKRIITLSLEAGDVKYQPDITCIDPEEGIGVSEFLDWMNNRFGAGDICEYGESVVICGICRLNCAVIAGKLSDDKVIICEETVAQAALKSTTDDNRYKFTTSMIRCGLQFSADEQRLVKRYTPQPGDRVAFTSATTSGLGVVKTVHLDTDSVDYFCYYINETGKVGYSMNEIGVTKLSDLVFEKLDDSVRNRICGNVVYLQRKLNDVLRRYGKVWKEKLHRIEPLDPTVPVGKPYWYFNDKMELTKDIEKGRVTSRRRYFAGNYFKSEAEGMVWIGKINELLRMRYGLPDSAYVDAEGLPRKD